MTRAQIEEKAARAWRLWLWAFERSDAALLNAASRELAVCAAAVTPPMPPAGACDLREAA